MPPLQQHKPNALQQQYQPNALELAALIIIVITRYERDKKRRLSRLRFSRRTIRRLAIRSNLREVLIDEWIEAMAQLYQWAVFPLGDEFILVRLESADQWTRLGTNRVDDIIVALRRGDRGPLDEALDELPEPAENSEEDEAA